jgi:hypothetical protein
MCRTTQQRALLSLRGGPARLRPPQGWAGPVREVPPSCVTTVWPLRSGRPARGHSGRRQCRPLLLRAPTAAVHDLRRRQGAPPTQDPPSSVRHVCRWSSRHLCTLRTRRTRPVRHRAAGMRPLSHDNGAPVLCLRVSDHHAQHRGPVALSGLLHAARRDVRSVPARPHHRSVRHRRRSGSLRWVLAGSRDDMSGLRQGRALPRRTQGLDALLAMSALAGADMQSLWSVSFTNRSVA